MPALFDQSDHDKHRFWNTAPVDPLREAKKRGLAYTTARPLMPDSPFPFGEHLGKTMRQVPADFLRWVDAQPWAATWRAWQPVRDYLQRFPVGTPCVASVNDREASDAAQRVPTIYVSPIAVDPGARGIFKDGAARLYVAHEAHLEHLRCFAAGALDLRADWLRPADATAPPHYLITPARQEHALGMGAELVTRRQVDEHTCHWRRTHGAATPSHPAGHAFMREMPDGTLQCTKHCYTKREAETTINQRLEGRHRHRRNRPTYLRAYECPRCGHWHLTSKPDGEWRRQGEEETFRP